jgi:hypothetical protein
VVKSKSGNLYIKDDKKNLKVPNYKTILDELIKYGVIEGLNNIGDIFTKVIPKSILLNNETGKKYVNLIKAYKDIVENLTDVKKEHLFENSLYKEILNDFFGDVEIIDNPFDEDLLKFKLSSLLRRALITPYGSFNPTYKDYLVNRYIYHFLKQKLGEKKLKNNKDLQLLFSTNDFDQIEQILTKYLTDKEILELFDNITKLLYDYFVSKDFNIMDFIDFDFFKEFLKSLDTNKNYATGYVNNYVIIKTNDILRRFENWLKKQKRKQDNKK